MGRKDFYIRMRFAGSPVRRIALGSISNQGARSYQEDSFGFSSIRKGDVDKFGFSAIVADGMGGLSGGAQVSGFVVSSMIEMLKTRDSSIPVHLFLSNALCTINNRVAEMGMSGGSTAVSVLCQPDGIHWGTVGDSRVYLFRDETLTVLNEDSDYFNRLIEDVISGDMTFEEAKDDSKKDALDHYIGYKGVITPDVNAKPLKPAHKDKLLLCSDGVYNALSTVELCEALSNPAQQAAEVIESGVMSKGYSNQDNFTAIVLEFIR